MRFKKFIFLFVLKFFLMGFAVKAQPLVILEYSQNNNEYHNTEASDHNNESFSTYHKVKKNETLSKIIQKYYGNKGLNLTFVQAAILYKNKNAFVRSNPNFMFAKKNLYLPSISEIKELVYKKKNANKLVKDTETNKEIYFFGN
tara:strand:+ start:29 stop:460 length:432 start_codon:yes stop_codon:yes gene_type:complete